MTETPTQFLEWLASLDDDDPNSPGRIDRKTVRLQDITDRARAALAAVSDPWVVEAGDHLVGPFPTERDAEQWVRALPSDSPGGWDVFALTAPGEPRLLAKAGIAVNTTAEEG